MGLSGTRAYIETRDSIITDALRDIGVLGLGQSPENDQVDEAARWLHRIVLHAQTRGKFLWTATDKQQVLVAETPNYTLASSVVGIENVFFRANEADSPLSPLTRREYKELANKAGAGNPSHYYVDYQLAAPVIYLWPVYGYATSVITGSDANAYLCTVDHELSSDTTPITGADYADYWESSSETDSVIADGTACYSGILKYTEVIRLQDFNDAGDNPDAPATGYKWLVAALAAELANPYGLPLKERLWYETRAEKAFVEFINGGQEEGDLYIQPNLTGRR